MKPNLFIVGEQKCGTSALHKLLNSHKDIFMSEIKEPGYFCKDLQSESDRYHNKQQYYETRTQEQYLKHFKKAKNEKYVGESTSTYLYSKCAAQEIFNYNPNAKIIIILRNPCDFLISLHNQYLKETTEEEESLVKAIKLEKSRKQGQNIPKRTRAPSLLFYTERIKYSKNLDRYYKIFPHKNILLIFHDQITMDNKSVYLNILKFLNLKNESQCITFPKENISSTYRFKTLYYALHNPQLKLILLKLLPIRIQSILKNQLNKLFLIKNHRAQSTKEREFIHEISKLEIQNLNDFLINNNINASHILKKWTH